MTLVAATLAGLAVEAPVARADELAQALFGAQKLPSTAAPQSYGFYSKGCFSGGVAIATDGPHWQAMRLSRNRRWGHPALISVLEKLSEDGAKVGWNGLLLGDVSQPRGGPMTSGHASHQIGLDADIWFTPMPGRRLSGQERETISAVSMIRPGTLQVDNRLWTKAHTAILKAAASQPQIERILVHPGIKKKLCDTVTGDRSWLGKVRPFWGHDAHFHIRIGCQPGSPDCKKQAAVPAGDGCDKSLAWWFTEEPWRPNENPDAPKARDTMTMAALPAACRAVLAQPAPVSEAAVTYPGNGGLPTTVASRAVPEQPVTAQPVIQPPADVGVASATGIPTPAVSDGLSSFAPTPDRGVPLPTPRPRN